MKIKEIIIVQQEEAESKLNYLNTLESLEKRGYKEISSGCYNKEKRLAETTLLRESIMILDSGEIVDEANKILGLN